MGYPLVSLIAAAVGGACAAAGVILVRGSTAVPAAVWGLVAWLALAAEMVLRSRGQLVDLGAAASMRLVVVALALCPAMSLLGAKRPQHGVWQFIVASLAVVLALPVGRALVLMPGSLPAVHLLAEWFMLALAIVGWMNFIATRRGVAATLITGGQLVLMRPFLPGLAIDTQIAGVIASPVVDCVAVTVAAVGTLLAVAQGSRREGLRQASLGSVHPLAAVIDPPFLALRETLGAAWALRIAERFDQIAVSRGWPCRLSFRGLSVSEPNEEGAWHRDAERAFAALMRRFVTVDWLRAHARP
jgi:hypothetical protein